MQGKYYLCGNKSTPSPDISDRQTPRDGTRPTGEDGRACRLRGLLTLAAGLIVGDIVGEAVFVAGVAGEVFGQELSGAANAVKDAVGEVAFAKVDGNLLGDFLPEFVAATGMDGGVANNGELANARSDKDEDAVLLFGFVHAQVLEGFLRGSHGVGRLLAADENADFAAGVLFSLANGFDNGVVLQLI
jgi:hypothetical protein